MITIGGHSDLKRGSWNGSSFIRGLLLVEGQAVVVYDGREFYDNVKHVKPRPASTCTLNRLSWDSLWGHSQALVDSEATVTDSDGHVSAKQRI